MQAGSLRSHLSEAFRDEPLQVIVQDMCLIITHAHVSCVIAFVTFNDTPPSTSPVVLHTGG